MKKEQVKIKLIHPDAKLPFYGTEESAGFDLYSIEEKTIQPRSTEVFQTGLKMECSPGFCFKFRDRSGLAIKGITHFGGLIDSDYRGEFKVVLHNTSSEPYTVEKGDRIIQVVLSPIVQADFQKVEELSNTGRGANGFHSTGKK